jgi:hypothetical protein
LTIHLRDRCVTCVGISNIAEKHSLFHIEIGFLDLLRCSGGPVTSFGSHLGDVLGMIEKFTYTIGYHPAKSVSNLLQYHNQIGIVR